MPLLQVDGTCCPHTPSPQAPPYACNGLFNGVGHLGHAEAHRRTYTGARSGSTRQPSSPCHCCPNTARMLPRKAAARAQQGGRARLGLCVLGAVVGEAVVRVRAAHERAAEHVRVAPRRMQRGEVARRQRRRARRAAVVRPRGRPPAVADHKAARAIPQNIPAARDAPALHRLAVVVRDVELGHWRGAPAGAAHCRAMHACA